MFLLALFSSYMVVRAKSYEIWGEDSWIDEDEKQEDIKMCQALLDGYNKCLHE